MAERSGQAFDRIADRMTRYQFMDTLVNSENAGKISVDNLREVLQTGWDVNENLAKYDDCAFHSERHTTALHEAIRLGWIEGVKILLEAGAKCKSSDTMTNPLALALQKGRCDPDIIELLLTHGADPNHHTTDGDVPLLLAIICRNRNISRVVRLLLDHGANPNIMQKLNMGGNNWVNRSALEHAVEGGLYDTSKNLLSLALQNQHCPPDLFELLLKAGVDPNAHDDQFGNIPLLSAIDGWNLQGILLLLKHGANPNVTYRVNIGTKELSRTALHLAIQKGNTKILKILQEAGAKVDTEALNEAIKQRLIEVVKKFLFLGVKADASSLNEAIKQRSFDIMVMLLDACATCAIPQNTLTLALENYCPPKLIDLLLNHCTDPHDHDDNTFHGIHIFCAIKNCRHDPNSATILRLLMKHGADPNVTHEVKLQDNESHNWVTRTALHEAEAEGWTEGVRILLDSGVKCKRDALENPLTLALLRNKCSPELIELLLKNGADPNHNNTGDFPISLALKKNVQYWRIVPLLLEYGANPNVTHSRLVGTSHGLCRVPRRPIHEAVELGWPAGVKMLLDAGAECSGLGPSDNPLMLALQNDKLPTESIELLLKHGAGKDVGDSTTPHMLFRYMFRAHEMFPRHLLDFFFLHGGNINIKNYCDSTLLEFSVMQCNHCNITRWLIRHGADQLQYFGLLKGYSVQSHRASCHSETTLILMQAGMRLLPEAQKQFQNMEHTLLVWLQDDNEAYGNADINHEGKRHIMLDMWDPLEKERLQRLQHNSRKSTFPEYWSQQMEDLQGFSDSSLNVYPEDAYISPTFENRQGCQHILNQIQRVLDFLHQPQSLQWYSRRCVRESLVSLQPSVVKSLPVPYILKPYILCHEI